MMPKTKKHLIAAGTALLILSLICGLTLLLSGVARTKLRVTIETIIAHSYSVPKDAFPDVPQASLNDTQKHIIRLTKQEYAKRPVSFDSNVLKYSQGYKEPWCANFASWIMKNAGMPFSNPNSGSWRIPGVSTLQEYFQAEKRYEVAGDYTPRVGDIAIFKDNRSHANIVIAVRSNKMTTVGGNENGRIRINTQTFEHGSQGLSGFGKLRE